MHFYGSVPGCRPMGSGSTRWRRAPLMWVGAGLPPNGERVDSLASCSPHVGRCRVAAQWGAGRLAGVVLPSCGSVPGCRPMGSGSTRWRRAPLMWVAAGLPPNGERVDSLASCSPHVGRCRVAAQWGAGRLAGVVLPSCGSLPGCRPMGSGSTRWRRAPLMWVAAGLPPNGERVDSLASCSPHVGRCRVAAQWGAGRLAGVVLPSCGSVPGCRPMGSGSTRWRRAPLMWVAAGLPPNGERVDSLASCSPHVGRCRVAAQWGAGRLAGVVLPSCGSLPGCRPMGSGSTRWRRAPLMWVAAGLPPNGERVDSCQGSPGRVAKWIRFPSGSATMKSCASHGCSR